MPPPSSSRSYLPHILIIDDNQDIHRDFDLAFLDESHNPELEATEDRVFLGEVRTTPPRAVYELEHAMTGMEGLEKVRQALGREHHFQVAFVDIRMPGIDGVETVFRLWEIDPSVQVVIVTAYADYSWDDLAARLGQTDKLLLLKKPFEYIEVVQMASTLAEKWLLARQAAQKLEQMELLVARRTQSILELQRGEQERLRETDQLRFRLFTTLSQELRSALRILLRPPAWAPENGNADREQELMRRTAEDLLRLIDQIGPPPAPEETMSEGGIDQPGGDKELPLVLLVAGDAEVSRYLAQGLGSSYRIVEAAEVEQGVRCARELVPDMVIADISLPGLTGLELCRRLKGDELASHVPIILLGADASASHQIEALEAGADDYVTRPFSPSRLRTRMEGLLESRRRLSERFARGSSLQPRDVATNQVDAQFLRRTTETVEKHMSDFEFDVKGLAEALFVSRRQLLRKLKALVGCAPNVFIRRLRVKRAAELLRSSGMTVSEITYAVGFSDLKHFRAVFREEYGLSPAEYARKAEEGGGG